MKLRSYTIGIVVCLLQAVVLFDAHSHSVSPLTHHDSDVLVQPVENTTGLIYSGRFYYPQQPDNWKWIALGEDGNVRYRGKLLIFRYISVPRNPCEASGGYSRVNTLGRIDTLRSTRLTHRASVRLSCSCYRYTLSRWQRLDFRSRTSRYIIYYRGEVEIHSNDGKTLKQRRKPEHRVKSKQQPNRQPLRRVKKETKQERVKGRKPVKQRRRARCGVSSHNR